ncbi:MAG: ABC transporter ATP-binding protein [Anaerolineales bacterium]
MHPEADRLDDDSPGLPRSYVQTHNLTRTFRRGSEDVHALVDVTLVIAPSAFAVVLGPSGSGKSTLLNLIGGIDRPTRGHVRVDGLELDSLTERQLDGYRRDHVGFVFQFNNLLPNLSALENVALPLVAQGRSWAQARDQAAVELTALGMGDRATHRPSELSGGEQQRVALARAVISRPALVLADEPTGDLDSASAEIVLDLMSSLNRDLGATFVIATHNPRLESRATHVIELTNGRMAAPALRT